jgi:hypothetical protein
MNAVQEVRGLACGLRFPISWLMELVRPALPLGGIWASRRMRRTVEGLIEIP